MTWDLKEGKWIRGANTKYAAQNTAPVISNETPVPEDQRQTDQSADDEYPGWMNLFEDPITRLSDILTTYHAVHDSEQQTGSV